MVLFGLAVKTPSRRFSRTLSIFLAFVAISLLTRAVLLPVSIIDLDEAAHITGSWELMQGKILYTDFVDNKPPLVYVYYALAQILFGRGMLAVRLLTNLITIPLTAYAASAYFDHDRRGIIAGVVFLIYSAAFLGHDMLAVNAEILMLLPATAALVMLKREDRAKKFLRVLLSGFLIGIAALLKYQAILWLPALAAAILVTPGAGARKIRVILVLILGFLIPLAGTYLIFAATGAANNLLHWTIFQNISYTENPIPLTEIAQRFAFKFLPFLIVTGFLWWEAYRSRDLLARYEKVMLGALLLFSLPAAFLGFRFYPHYFVQLYIPLALASATHLNTLLARPLTAQAKWFAGYTLFVLIGFTVANGILYYWMKSVYQETNPVFGEVADRLHAVSTNTDDTLFVWGFAPQFYYSTRLRPASRFVMPQTSLTGYIAGNTYSARGHAETSLIDNADWDLLMADLEKNRATYILDTAPSGIHRWNYFPIRKFPRLFEYINAHYRLMDNIRGVSIYQRAN
ncbi:MAG: hypothetical protein C5B54_11210 [Acidobacteria bacterium]|nr:MAG: hypothetical protein C5B54_11210 [Acidobacteriota bacterium]